MSEENCHFYKATDKDEKVLEIGRELPGSIGSELQGAKVRSSCQAEFTEG